MDIESSSEDESQSSTEDSQMVMNVDDPDVREFKVEDDSECSSTKLDEKSNLNFQSVFESPLKGFSAEHLLNIVGKDVLTDKLCKNLRMLKICPATFTRYVVVISATYPGVSKNYSYRLRS